MVADVRAGTELLPLVLPVRLPEEPAVLLEPLPAELPVLPEPLLEELPVLLVELPVLPELLPDELLPVLPELPPAVLVLTPPDEDPEGVGVGFLVTLVPASPTKTVEPDWA